MPFKLNVFNFSVGFRLDRFYIQVLSKIKKISAIEVATVFNYRKNVSPKIKLAN